MFLMAAYLHPSPSNPPSKNRHHSPLEMVCGLCLGGGGSSVSGGGGGGGGVSGGGGGGLHTSPLCFPSPCPAIGSAGGGGVPGLTNSVSCEVKPESWEDTLATRWAGAARGSQPAAAWLAERGRPDTPAGHTPPPPELEDCRLLMEQRLEW